MIIFAIYIIKSDGTLLLSDNYQSKQFETKEYLRKSFIHAAKGFALEVMNGELHTIDVQNRKLNIKSFGMFYIAIFSDVNDEIEPIIKELGYKFMKEYGESILDENPRIDKYLPFKTIIKERITFHLDKSHKINPSLYLSAKNILLLPESLKKVAISLISLKEGTLVEIAKECQLEFDVTKQSLLELQQLGYVGEKFSNDDKIYFCLTF